MLKTAKWAQANGKRWAFSLSNAGAAYAEFRSSLDCLGEINWAAVEARNFQAEEVKEGKQAEFLVAESFTWELVERIGVRSPGISQRASDAMRNANHRPRVEIKRDWYY